MSNAVSNCSRSVPPTCHSAGGVEGLEPVDFGEVEALAKGGLGVAGAYIKDRVHGRSLAEEGLTAFRNDGRKGQLSTLQGYVGMC